MTLKHLIAPSLVALTLSLAACNNGGTDTASKDAVSKEATKVAVVNTKPVLGDFGIATENIDQSVKPGDDFFQYVNGKWLENTEIPADKSSYGGFSVLRDLSEERVKTIIEKTSAMDAPTGSEEQKIGDMYAAFMDVDAIEAAGLTAVQSDLDAIAAAQSHEDIARLMADPSLGIRSVVAPFVSIDAKDVENYIVYLTQSGLGMPNRDYYLDEGKKSDEIRAAYVAYVQSMLEAAGEDDAAEKARNIMAFETALAKVHWTPTQRRDRSKTYNKRSLADIKKSAPGLSWDVMLETSDLGGQETFIVREVDAIDGTAKIFANTDVDTLKDYLTVSYLGGKSAYLPKAIGDANFEFYGKTLRGTEVQRARWKRGVSQIDGMMGEMVGKVYVKEYFPPVAKKEMDELISNLRASFKDGIDNLEWMGDETKVEAQDKLAKFTPKIGYPDKWTDYSELKIDRNDLIGNVKSASLWGWEDNISKLGGPIDRDEWGMNPQTVNAYYRPDLNEIVFPAAILQAPFFDPAADAAVNYGGIGAVIGHEMGHGFDDQGRKTDGNGEQRDWWTAEDVKAFEARTNALVDQYNSFEPLPGVNVNGKLTLGENIGDLTGITMAYAAYKKSLNGKEAPVIDGMTGDQRFFLSWGQIWQRKYRDAALRNQVKADPHSPSQYRANGIVRNFDAWYDAFDVQPGDALYLPPEKRVKIW
ncbi:M13 family metallopeptidase [Hellea sp.]|nr:M13 family metallopeptidase [Hellea sp.]